MLHRATVQYSPILHIVRHMHSRENHSDHEQQLAKIMAEVGSSPGVLLHDWLDEDSEESLNNKEIKDFV